MLTKSKDKSKSGHATGVDAIGGGPIDPTRNVMDLVEALKQALAEFRISDTKYVDTQLVAAEKLQNYARDAEAKMHKLALDAEGRLRDALRNADQLLAAAETRRIDQLATISQTFETTIRNMLAESVRTTSDLVSNQLVQIQATFNERVSKLEAGAFTQAGKSSVSDPATADALSRMAAGIASLSTTTTEAMNRTTTATADAIAKLTTTLTGLQSTETRASGQKMGGQDSNARLLAVVMACAAVASPVIATIATIVVMRGH